MSRLSLAVAAGLALAACGTEPSALRLAINVDRASLSAQDAVRLSLELVNQTDRTIRTTSPEGYGLCLHAFEVTDAANRDVNVLTGFCALALIAAPQMDLAPGQSISITDYWHPASSTLDGHALAPGVYRVRGRVAASESVVTSAAKAITITQ